MPMAIFAFIDLVASAGCYLTSPILYNVHNELALPLWVAFVFCSVSLICAFVALAITYYGETHGMVRVRAAVDV